jgi:(4-(4-[2-(gamma-L-glutamylamino)ethyl]phenoxymethyl)furan-2-yl)methanamine synthase
MTRTLGWDIGGAHLKLALVDNGNLVAARQLPCALWRGLGELQQAANAALDGLPAADRHAVTMTGELVDFFTDRTEGVSAILDFLTERVDTAPVAVYATEGIFLPPAEAKARPIDVASANWHATTRYLASTLGSGLLVDIGSTTTDIIPFRAGRIAARGTTDTERLTTGELAYIGIARTPLAAVARHVPFAGRLVGVMAEFFATSADAHRVAGTLPEGADLHPTADGRGKTPAESRARLARMIGMDESAAPEWAWRRLAETFIRQQTRQIEEAVDLVLSGVEMPSTAPLVGAGAGRFLAAEIARRLGRPYRGIEDIIPMASSDLASRASDIAPAVAVALLLPN